MITHKHRLHTVCPGFVKSSLNDSSTHDVFFVFGARIIDGTPTVTDDEEIVQFKWVDAQEANDLLAHWSLDFTLHNEYRAFYHAAE